LIDQQTGIRHRPLCALELSPGVQVLLVSMEIGCVVAVEAKANVMELSPSVLASLVSMAIGSVVVVALASAPELHPSVVELLVSMALGSVIGTQPLLLVDALLPSLSVLELLALMESGCVTGTQLPHLVDALVQRRSVLALPALIQSGLVVTRSQVALTVQVMTQKLQIQIASMLRGDLAQHSLVQTPECGADMILEMV